MNDATQVHITHIFAPADSDAGQFALAHGAQRIGNDVAFVWALPPSRTTAIATVRPLTLPERVRMAAQRIARRLML